MDSLTPKTWEKSPIYIKIRPNLTKLAKQVCLCKFVKLGSLLMLFGLFSMVFGIYIAFEYVLNGFIIKYLLMLCEKKPNICLLGHWISKFFVTVPR